MSRVDAGDKVRGTSLYPGDLYREGMLHAAIVWSSRPHACLVTIDCKSALEVPGVVMILTAQDVPVNEFGYMLRDEHVLAEGKVRSVGDAVALVVADSRRAAEAAATRVEVEYEDLPAVFDPVEAMALSAPLVHEDLGVNLLRRIAVRRGDPEEAFERAGVVVEGTYHTQPIEHLFLEPEAALAYIDDDGRIVVESAGQWAHHERAQIAQALDVPEERVRVIHRTIGGAFGGREDISLQILAALAAHRTGRAVKMAWTRPESMRGHHKRHPFLMRYRTAAGHDGRLLALEARLMADAGAYASTSPAVLGTAVLLATGPYEIPHVSIEASAVYTNNLDNGAMRGFGAPQVAFAAEMQMNKLAEALGMDPVELRMRNVVSEGSPLAMGGVVPEGTEMAETLRRTALAAGWRIEDGRWVGPSVGGGTSGRRKGIGVGCGWKNSGFVLGFPDRAAAEVVLHGLRAIEGATVRSAVAEMGQGSATMMARLASDILGLPLEHIHVVWWDSDHPDGGSASASRVTLVVGEAVAKACREALVAWGRGDRPARATVHHQAPQTKPADPALGQSSQPAFAITCGTQVAEVEVDVETGMVKLLQVWSGHDVGRVIDRQGVIGQVEGGVIMAQGAALLENFVQREGAIETPNLQSYLIPGGMDVPLAVHPVLIEAGPGAVPKGVAEIPVVMLAPAIAAAVHEAMGRWVDELPITPARVLALQ